MIFTMTLPNQTSVMTVKDLLEQEWLVPRKVRHFIRTRKGLLINGEPCHFQSMASLEMLLHLQSKQAIILNERFYLVTLKEFRFFSKMSI